MGADSKAAEEPTHRIELTAHLDLIVAFQRAELTVEAFEKRFYKLYNYDDTPWNPAELEVWSASSTHLRTFSTMTNSGRRSVESTPTWSNIR